MQIATTDIVLACTLICHKHKLAIITVIGSRGTFHFMDIPDEFQTMFELDNIKVSPVDFHNNLRRLTTSVRRIAGII